MAPDEGDDDRLGVQDRALANDEEIRRGLVSHGLRKLVAEELEGPLEPFCAFQDPHSHEPRT